ncbi:hypothetical protein E2C01_097482 [Portunus trituberculatus]|uniref:Uncharacterized protein n=1 Tax=Portunus trituberculatus TaxID=210409 RepID=A0A5B7K0J9_PORTR|nr:hypothetical protein [Portunus trituberculatus]
MSSAASAWDGMKQSSGYLSINSVPPCVLAAPPSLLTATLLNEHNQPNCSLPPSLYLLPQSPLSLPSPPPSPSLPPLSSSTFSCSFICYVHRCGLVAN